VHKRALYSQLAKYYDKIYWGKDYGREAEFLVTLFHRYGVTGRKLLEVGCGTGNHTRAFVARGYRVTAVDLSEAVLKIASGKVKRGAQFVQGDMRDLDEVVEGEYDGVVCLFSTISYNLTKSDLRKTLRGFYNHVKEDGIVAFDTHFTKKGFLDGYRGEDIFDDGKVIGARLSTSKRAGDIGEISFTYLIKDGKKVTTLRNDIHRLGLFAPEDFLRIMKEVGFKKTEAYSDWTFRRRINAAPFKDTIFVGRRSAL
jgi:ubiquinone/menaquinone biosynthesis C-methylase UbiE